MDVLYSEYNLSYPRQPYHEAVNDFRYYFFAATTRITPRTSIRMAACVTFGVDSVRQRNFLARARDHLGSVSRPSLRRPAESYTDVICVLRNASSPILQTTRLINRYVAV